MPKAFISGAHARTTGSERQPLDTCGCIRDANAFVSVLRKGLNDLLTEETLTLHTDRRA